jgi:hypothetical protein
MNVRALFGLSGLMGLVAWSFVFAFFAWPRLRALPRNEALTWLAAPHWFRFIGLGFLVPGVVSPALPEAFAAPAAYGDWIAMGLALVAALALRKGLRWAIAVTWAFNLWGTADLLYAIASRIDPALLGAAFFIPTAVVPGLLVSHALAFRLLLTRDEALKPANVARAV